MDGQVDRLPNANASMRLRACFETAELVSPLVGTGSAITPVECHTTEMDHVPADCTKYFECIPRTRVSLSVSDERSP